MNTIEKVFIKTKSFVRQFDVQCRLSDSHKEINKPLYDKALVELDEAITELMKEKVLALTSDISSEDIKQLIEEKIIKIIEDNTKDVIGIDTEEGETEKCETEEESGDTVSPSEEQDADLQDSNSYFRVNVIGGIEIKDNILKVDEYFGLNIDICRNDSEISDLIKSKKIIRCRKSFKDRAKDINHLFVEA